MFLYYKLKATSSITEGNIRKINNEMGETCKACKRGRQTVVNLPNRAVIHGRAELRTSVFGSVTASKHGSFYIELRGVFILMRHALDLLLEVTYMLRESNNSLLELCVKASPKDLDINCQRVVTFIGVGFSTVAENYSRK